MLCGKETSIAEKDRGVCKLVELEVVAPGMVQEGTFVQPLKDSTQRVIDDTVEQSEQQEE